MKKYISFALALSLVFGSAAAPPENSFISDGAVIASAGGGYDIFAKKGGVIYTENEDGTLSVAGYEGKTKDLVIPEKVKGKTVTQIAMSAFGFNDVITSVTLPDTVTAISDGVYGGGGYSFAECKNLKKVVLGNGVESIGGFSFFKCEALEEVVFPDSLKYIGTNAFYGCVSLKNITLPKSLEKIDASFYGCTALTSVTIPDGAKEIGGYSFFDCKGITDIYIPKSVKKIGENAIGLIFGKQTDEFTGEIIINENTVIHCFPGSAAEKYAQENDLSYVYDMENVKVTGLANKVYTGKAIKPSPAVKIGKTTLKKGVDYTVSYKNNKKIGTAKVIIKGKGKYSGTINKSFKIIPKKSAVKKLSSPAAGQLKVTFKKVENCTGYQVTYSTSKKFKASVTKAASTKDKSRLVKKLRSGKTYYVKVRSYKKVNGKKIFSRYSAVKTIRVK